LKQYEHNLSNHTLNTATGFRLFIHNDTSILPYRRVQC